MTVEKIRMRLSIMQSENYKTLITLKSKKYNPFISKVKDFDYSEKDTKVILMRCEETVFPKDTDDNKQDEYSIALKDIKEVGRHE